MAYYSQSSIFSTEKAILRFNHGNYATVNVTVPRTKLSLNSESKYAVPAGLFIAEESANVYRYLPRAVVTTASSTSATTLAVDLSYLFTPGDVLYVLASYTVLTVATCNAAETQLITVEGYTSTSTAASTSTNAFATLIAANINETSGLRDKVVAVATGSTVYIYSKSGRILTVTESGTATATLSSATTVVNTTAIGTVATVAITGTITLTGNAAIVVPTGVKVGSPVKRILGLDVHAQDFTTATARDIAAYTESTGVETRYLPYIDDEIVNSFPKIRFDNLW